LLIAQFTRDVLDGAIRAIEERDGEVVGFMGDAILGLVRTAESTFFACCGIAEDVNKQCEYISTQQEEASQLWEVSPGGPSLKIGVEYGDLDVSTISSRFLGDQKLV
jgi:class 3 adenylate cyclase